ncbi:hypothetical protein BDN70DRAFT_442245 [Pholiota conissans]|uniref:Uncharacterized protein n=1 Tax=Pholiota conissans TaxID=109636 RepID=A0A9P5YMV7_9AGAR|nr:hypothetical protein BDN70DRAFT_442245 [Pholiota conissans]
MLTRSPFTVGTPLKWYRRPQFVSVSLYSLFPVEYLMFGQFLCIKFKFPYVWYEITRFFVYEVEIGAVTDLFDPQFLSSPPFITLHLLPMEHSNEDMLFLHSVPSGVLNEFRSEMYSGAYIRKNAAMFVDTAWVNIHELKQFLHSKEENRRVERASISTAIKRERDLTIPQHQFGASACRRDCCSEFLWTDIRRL